MTFFAVLTVIMLVLLVLGKLLAPLAVWAINRMEVSAARQHAVDMERLLAGQAQQAQDAARLHDELAIKFRRL